MKLEYKFNENLLELSQNKTDIKEAINEWYKLSFGKNKIIKAINETKDECSKCICSHIIYKSIKLYNINTGHMILSGKGCYKHFKFNIENKIKCPNKLKEYINEINLGYDEITSPIDYSNNIKNKINEMLEIQFDMIQKKKSIKEQIDGYEELLDGMNFLVNTLKFNSLVNFMNSIKQEIDILKKEEEERINKEEEEEEKRIIQERVKQKERIEKEKKEAEEKERIEKEKREAEEKERIEKEAEEKKRIEKEAEEKERIEKEAEEKERIEKESEEKKHIEKEKREAEEIERIKMGEELIYKYHNNNSYKEQIIKKSGCVPDNDILLLKCCLYYEKFYK